MSSLESPPTLPDEGGATDAPAFGSSMGRFVVLQTLGVGGMGVVLSAYDPQLDRKVALKLLRPDVLGENPGPEGSAALLREAQAMASLSHPNVLAVHEVGFCEAGAFVAMEYAEGRTLRKWLARTPPRTWSAIVEMLSAAGDGLAAAHRAGIIHRDFKPDNVLVGGDGRPRVSDFGLARTAARCAGTPGYMAPEQAAGADLDARADQFAFCVTLWEALQGDRPALDPDRPARTKAPPWVFRALQRGLAKDARDRWPTMEDLLVALRPRPRRAALLVAMLMALILGGAGAFALGRRGTVPDCDGGRAQVAVVWNDEARGRVAASFGKTGRPYAADAFARVDAALEGRIDAWGQAHREACEATRTRHEQSDTLLDLRMACLRRARAEIASLVSLLADASGDVVDRSVQGAKAAGDLAACADTAALVKAAPPPRDPARARMVEELRDELASLIALRRVGRWKEGLARGKELVARARVVGYPPVLAALLVKTACFDIDVGNVDDGIQSLFEAQRLAVEAAEDGVAADASAFLLFALGMHKNRYEAADMAYRFAAAATARAGSSPERLDRLYDFQGRVLARRGYYAAALHLQRMALILVDATFGPESYESVQRQKEVAGALDGFGQFAAAGRAYERAIASLERLVGSEHPSVATLVKNHAQNRINEHDFEGAEALALRAVGIFERALGPEHRRVADALYVLAGAQVEGLRLAAARATIERTIRIQEAAGAREAANLSLSYDVLAMIARREGKADEAHRIAQRALVMKRELYGVDHVGVAYTLREDAESLLALGRLAEARAAIAETVSIFERTLGREHPEVGFSLRVLGDVACAEQRPREAVAVYERSLALTEKALGAASRGLLPHLIGLADALLMSGDADRALAIAVRAAALPRPGLGDAESAELSIARARWALGLDRPGAVKLAMAARAGLAALPFPSRQLEAADRWLAMVRGGRVR